MWGGGVRGVLHMHWFDSTCTGKDAELPVHS